MLPDWTKEIAERAEKASPGPFKAHERGLERWREFEIRLQTGGTLFRSTSYGHMQYDAEFLAAARADVPRLLEALEVAMGALEYVANGWGTIIGVDADGTPLKGAPDSVQCRRRAREALEKIGVTK